MVVVSKPEGALYVFINFGRVKRNIANDANIMHQIKDQLNSIDGAKFFTTLDLKKGTISCF